jgi:hypothetical protein
MKAGSGGGAMRYLVFLFWLPALVVLYLSVHQEILSEKGRVAREKPPMTVHAAHHH